MRRPVTVVIGLLVSALSLTGCGFHGLYSAPLPGGADLGRHPYTITVDFVDVLDLVPQSAVKVDDVTVGKVDAIDLEGWHARVKLTVNGDVTLPPDARAELKQTSLLGEKYVSLERPPDAAAGDLRSVRTTPTIPLQRTGRNPEVEEILGAISLILNGGGLPQIRTITTELNNALKGRTGDVRRLIGTLNTFVGGLDAQKQQIVTAIQKVDALAVTLRAQEKVLTDTLDTLPGALDVLSDERTKLLGLLTGLDRLGGVAGGVIDATTGDLVRTLGSLDPVLTSLAAAGENLPKALELFTTFPFPRNVTDAIHGDYVNLSASIDLNLTDLLGNLLNPSAGTGPASSAARPSSQGARQPAPAIPGIGG